MSDSIYNVMSPAAVLLSVTVNEGVGNLIMFTANQTANNSCIGNAYYPH